MNLRVLSAFAKCSLDKCLQHRYNRFSKVVRTARRYRENPLSPLDS